MLATNVFILFFDRQSDFQPYCFAVGTQNNSSILSNFRRGRGYSGVSPGNGFCPVGGRNPMLAIPVDRVTAGNGVLPSRRIFIPSPTTTFGAQNGTFSLSHFQKFCSPRANKETGYIHNLTSRTALPCWCSFWFVYVTGFHCFKSV